MCLNLLELHTIYSHYFHFNNKIPAGAEGALSFLEMAVSTELSPMVSRREDRLSVVYADCTGRRGTLGVSETPFRQRELNPTAI